MIEPATPSDETYRIAALRALGLLDSKPERAFDDIVALARQVLGVPTALVSLVDSDRQWFKAALGLEAPETPRSVSFCGHAILQPDVLVVPDATQDPRFHDNPLVTGSPYIRFYAGVPLRLPTGYQIGTLCAIGYEPREDFDAGAIANIRLLGRLTVDAIAAGVMRRELKQARAMLDRHAAVWDAIDLPLAFVDADGKVETANKAFAALGGGIDPVGRAASEAIGLDAEAWSPDRMTRADVWTQTVATSAGSIEVHRGLDGFAFVGMPTKAG